MSYLSLLFFTASAVSKPIWLSILGIFIPAVLAIWGFIRAYGAWEQQKKREINLLFDQKRYERQLQACEGLWPLLAYMSNYENDKTIFIEANKGEYFFRKLQAEEYIRTLPKLFFDEGHGVFAPLEAREGLYHFRSIVYGLLLATGREAPDQNEVKVKNKEMVEVRIRGISEQVNASLRKMLMHSEVVFSD